MDREFVEGLDSSCEAKVPGRTSGIRARSDRCVRGEERKYRTYVWATARARARELYSSKPPSSHPAGTHPRRSRGHFGRERKVCYQCRIQNRRSEIGD